VNAIAEPRASLVAVPTLAEVAADPRLIERLPAPVCGALASQAAALIVQLAARVVASPASGSVADDGALIELAEAARRLGMKPATLRKLVQRDPFVRALTVNNGTDRLVFDPRRIADFVYKRGRDVR
jgi:hypothetical protein